MTANHMFSRHFAALAAIFTLATGVALTAAPSTARADGNIDCPPCRFLQVHDQDGLTFRDVAAEVQNGNQIVITAEVTVTGAAGRPRTGSIVFSAVMDHSDDASFMAYSDDVCMPSAMSRQASTQACDVLSRALHDAAATAATAPAAPIATPSTPDEGIIMRDGGICDPIRHIGC